MACFESISRWRYLYTRPGNETALAVDSVDDMGLGGVASAVVCTGEEGGSDGPLPDDKDERCQERE
jgi:hypothetical protein